MPERLSNEEVVRRYAAASVAGDLEAMSALRHPAWSVTWPQSGERVAGRTPIASHPAALPGRRASDGEHPDRRRRGTPGC